jgi:hypothetical protein
VNHCPKCGANWLGGDIYQTFLDIRSNPDDSQYEYYKDKTDQEIKEVAFSYGWYDDLDDYLKTNTFQEDRRADMPSQSLKQWKRCIGIYDRDLDRTVAWKCPDCHEEFEA